MRTLEPVSGQVGLRFLGKVISEGRDRTAITSVEAESEKNGPLSSIINIDFISLFSGKTAAAHLSRSVALWRFRLLAPRFRSYAAYSGVRAQCFDQNSALHGPSVYDGMITAGICRQ
jgi:hypothetical protein